MAGLLHLYGIVPTGHPVCVGERAGDLTRVRVVDLGRVAVAATEMPEDWRPGRSDVIAFADTVGRLFRDGPVLPFRFGTAVPDESAVHEQLGPRQRFYVEQLSRLEGKVEIELIATYQEERLLREVLERNPRVRRQAGRYSDASSVGQKIALGELVAADIERSKQTMAAWLLRRLSPAVTSLVQRTPSPDTVLKAALLVPRERLERLEQVLAEVLREAPGWLQVRRLGPLPPYSFSDIFLPARQPARRSR